MGAELLSAVRRKTAATSAGHDAWLAALAPYLVCELVADNAPALAINFLVWHLESASDTRLVGAVEFQFTAADRTVHTHIVRLSEPVSAELPGDLAVAAGRLLRRLAQEGLTRVARER